MLHILPLKCMDAYITYVHTYIHTYIHTIHTNTHTHTYTHTYTCIHTHRRTYTHTHTHIYTHTHTHTHTPFLQLQLMPFVSLPVVLVQYRDQLELPSACVSHDHGLLSLLLIQYKTDFSLLGSTVLYTLAYRSSALAHIHIDLHA